MNCQVALRIISLQATGFLFEQRSDPVFGNMNARQAYPEALGHLARRPFLQGIQVEDLELLFMNLGPHSVQSALKQVLLPLLLPE